MERGRGEGTRPPAARAPRLCPATVSSGSMACVTDSNHSEPLWQPPPTACPTASRAPSLLMHPQGGGGSSPTTHPELLQPPPPKRVGQALKGLGSNLNPNSGQCSEWPVKRFGFANFAGVPCGMCRVHGVQGVIRVPHFASCAVCRVYKAGRDAQHPSASTCPSISVPVTRLHRRAVHVEGNACTLLIRTLYSTCRHSGNRRNWGKHMCARCLQIVHRKQGNARMRCEDVCENVYAEMCTRLWVLRQAVDNLRQPWAPRHCGGWGPPTQPRWLVTPVDSMMTDSIPMAMAMTVYTSTHIRAEMCISAEWRIMSRCWGGRAFTSGGGGFWHDAMVRVRVIC